MVHTPVCTGMAKYTACQSILNYNLLYHNNFFLYDYMMLALSVSKKSRTWKKISLYFLYKFIVIRIYDTCFTVGLPSEVLLYAPYFEDNSTDDLFHVLVDIHIITFAV